MSERPFTPADEAAWHAEHLPGLRAAQAWQDRVDALAPRDRLRVYALMADGSSADAALAAVAGPALGWHLSSGRNRASIAREGLRASSEGLVWVLDDALLAHALAGSWCDGDNDVWSVDLGGLAPFPDPHPSFPNPAIKAHAFAVPGPIPPGRLGLVSPNPKESARG